MPRRCSICSRSDLTEVNHAICNNSSYRSIAAKFGVVSTTLQRHIETCLKLDLTAIKNGHTNKQQIDVYEEFCEQLVFAKELRIAAREYLSDIEDPLKLSITPKAHEIEVTYFDHNDMVKLSFGNKVIEKPKKKRAMLSAILESFADKSLEPEKYKFSVGDIRKFALEAIDRADMCIDKFARMGGNYVKDADNPANVESAASWIKEFIRQRQEFALNYPDVVAAHPELGFTREGLEQFAAATIKGEAERLGKPLDWTVPRLLLAAGVQELGGAAKKGLL